MNRAERGDVRVIGGAFLVSAVASLGLTVVYALGGQPQLEGALLGVALGGIALGLTLFAKHLLPSGGAVEQREMGPDEAAQREAAEAFDSGAEPLERRGFLAKALGAALAALGIATLFPIRSLGARPGRSLFVTEWRRGRRLVTEAGRPIRPHEVAVGTVLTVFPDGHIGSADSQTLLIRLPPAVPVPEPREWSFAGLVAFSKICTHAGCPVGLYQAATQELFCPCHQSTFSVPEGAKPTFGPATRPLPQLPIGLDPGGYLVALSDFPEAVGPGFWRRPAG
ncbi:MAG: Rieske (2Fe-2S) protein [Actinomycetota bacterium]|nr:Rieske (2Fe-2S) protein [Actinomycetota bacterium]